jgi:hypothetical protein
MPRNALKTLKTLKTLKKIKTAEVLANSKGGFKRQRGKRPRTLKNAERA